MLFPQPRKGRAYRPVKLCTLTRAKRTRANIPSGPCRSVFNRVHPKGAPTAPAGLYGGCLVDLQFYHPSAGSVCVVGTFGEGTVKTIPLEHLGGGAWVARLVLVPGRYEYHFLVDGACRPDPLATEFSYGPAGEVYSVLRVE